MSVINHKAATVNLEITQGSDVVLPMVRKANGTPINITGYVYVAQIRDQQDTLYCTATITLADPVNGGLTIQFNDNETVLLNPSIVYLWALKETAGTVTRHLMSGQVLVQRKVV